MNALLKLYRKRVGIHTDSDSKEHLHEAVNWEEVDIDLYTR